MGFVLEFEKSNFKRQNNLLLVIMAINVYLVNASGRKSFIEMFQHNPVFYFKTGARLSRLLAFYCRRRMVKKKKKKIKKKMVKTVMGKKN